MAASAQVRAAEAGGGHGMAGSGTWRWPVVPACERLR